MSANGDSNKSEFRLKSEPEDGISAVRFGPNSSQFLLVSSWGKLSLNDSFVDGSNQYDLRLPI